MENIFKNVEASDFISAGLIILVTFVVVKITNKAFNNDKLNLTLHLKFIKNAVIAIEWVIGLLSALYRFEGLQHLVSTMLAGSGIVALVIGLGAQESFSNIFSGILICLFKPFNIGDKIRIDDSLTSGYVDDITLMHTVIRTYTNIIVTVPNSVMAKAKIENSTTCEGASYPIEIDIAYEHKEKRYRAMEIMREVVTSHPMFYIPKLEITNTLCINYGASGITLKILMWTADVGDNAQACSDCRLQILDRFEEEGIEVPYSKIQILN